MKVLASRIVPYLPILYVLQISSEVKSEETPLEIRSKIINIIEDELSSAYSYTMSSSHHMPHFEVIDRLFPKWHHGDAATARHFWVEAGYRIFYVLYRVDYVYVVNDATVKIEGKRFVLWSEKEDVLDVERFWPFQLWASLQKRSHRDDTYLHAAYAMRYKMKLSLNEKGEWIITEEKLLDNPNMLNNIKNHCRYEKLLADWGLKNNCNAALLPL